MSSKFIQTREIDFDDVQYIRFRRRGNALEAQAKIDWLEDLVYLDIEQVRDYMRWLGVLGE